MTDFAPHASDCATYNAPALLAGECDCPLGDIEALVTACEKAYAGPYMADFADDSDISSPPTGITFGMIRRARAALEGATL